MRGSYFKLLSADEQSGRFTLLIKIEKGVRAPAHRHIGAVEAYILEGGFYYSDAPEFRFSAGTYLFEPEGTLHEPVSEEGAILLAVFHGPVEGLNKEGASVGTIDWKWHVDAWNAGLISKSSKTG